MFFEIEDLIKVQKLKLKEFCFLFLFTKKAEKKFGTFRRKIFLKPFNTKIKKISKKNILKQYHTEFVREILDFF